MNIISICLACCFISGLSFAKPPEKTKQRRPSSLKLQMEKIKCLVDQNGSDRINLLLQQTMGSAPESKTTYKGHRVAVGFFPGDPSEGQQVLVLELDGMSSKIYDPQHSLFVLESPSGIKVQCFVEN